MMRGDRYRRPELQNAYGAGFAQMYDHQAVGFRDAMQYGVTDAAETVAPSGALAAAYEGAAEALRALAAQAREAAKIERRLSRDGT